VEHSTIVEMVAGDKVAHEVVREEAFEEVVVVAVVEVVAVAVAVVDVVVAATYTARASDHTAQNSHTKNLVLVLRCSVAEVGNIQDSRASS
jgi:cytochrome c-type biogenesis protein CcmH/NrfF